jgi:uncharacterized protein (TIGR00369 family)
MVCLDKSEPGRTTWRMAADERFANPAGIIQGGFLGAFCDSAMGASAVTFSRSRPEHKGQTISCANLEMKTSFFRPVPTGGVLTCVATVASGSDRVVFCEAEVRDDSDRLVAKATSTYVVGRRG